MNTLQRLSVLPFCLLTACVPPRPAVELPENKVIPVEQRKAQSQTISSWEIQGAIAAKNKSKGWSATLNWVQNGPSNYTMRLMGPLGGGTVLINKKGTTLTFKDGPKTVSSTNADELLLQQTGIRLPVDHLYYWVRGLTAPGAVQSEQHDKYNHLTQLKQSGYTIDFTKFTAVKGVDLPSMIRLEGNGVMVKVVIKNWGV